MPAIATTYFGAVEVRNWLVAGAEQVLTYPHPAVKLLNGTTPAVATYLHRDGLSSVRAITNAAGVKIEAAFYKPFGEQSEWVLPCNAAPETKGWIGERYDADAGLQYLNARYYDPELSLFLQPDWFEVTKAGVGTNRFSYSFNDPVNKFDPGGNVVPIVGIIVATSIGYFSSTNPANAPGPGDATLPPSGDAGLLLGATGGGVVVSGSKLAAGSCVASPTCSNVLRAYVAAETATDVTGCASGDMGSCAAAAVPGVPGGTKHAIPDAAPERIVANTNSLGETVISIQGKEMSIHASKQATTRGISNEDVAGAMDQKPFSYVQNGETLQGYYDPVTNVFVGVGDRITTVINRLCCTTPVRDSSRESSVIAGVDEQTEHTDLQNPELARV